MIQLLNTDFSALKEEIKSEKQAITKATKGLKKLYEDKKVLPKEVESQVAVLTYKRDFIYSASRILPVKINELIINYKVYAAFMKKLSDFQIEESINSVAFKLSYRNKDSHGCLLLEDLSAYFHDFKHIPEARIGRYGEEA
ncbi:hypothetical protein J9303_00370 [Bacillaceae bacterium Marseille-Q3522]|nr:hypothetical protein [Bacillaceae bacterium Marseille-Q3522]